MLDNDKHKTEIRFWTQKDTPQIPLVGELWNVYCEHNYGNLEFCNGAAVQTQHFFMTG